jgi:DNA-directed RNA polymerase subunit RPC12/RpoP
MFEYACPRCQRVITLATAPTGRVTACPGCGQRLSVIAEADDATVVTAPAAPARSRGCLWPLLALACWMVGFLGAGGILGAWYFFGRGSSS